MKGSERACARCASSLPGGEYDLSFAQTPPGRPVVAHRTPRGQLSSTHRWHVSANGHLRVNSTPTGGRWMVDPSRRERSGGGHAAAVSPVSIAVVNDRLELVYRSAPLGNKQNPLDELVYIQLSVRTRERAYQQTYAALRRLVGGSGERLLTAEQFLRGLPAWGARWHGASCSTGSNEMCFSWTPTASASWIISAGCDRVLDEAVFGGTAALRNALPTPRQVPRINCSGKFPGGRPGIPSGGTLLVRRVPPTRSRELQIGCHSGCITVHLRGRTSAPAPGWSENWGVGKRL